MPQAAEAALGSATSTAPESTARKRAMNRSSNTSTPSADSVSGSAARCSSITLLAMMALDEI